MSSAAPANQDALIAEFASFTGLAPAEAEQFLAAGNWDIQRAAALFYEEAAPPNDSESEVDMAGDEPPNPPQQQQQQQQPGGGRTLAGDYVPPTASSSSQQPDARRQPPQRGLRTLGDLQASSGDSHGHAHGGDNDDDSDYQDDENQDFFAGGEKSGLAVQNPNQSNPQDYINNILRRARQNAPRPGGDDERPTSRFQGAGMTLGGDDQPSRAVPDPNAHLPQPAPRVRRELHLWRNGFSVDDGPLFSFNDPANARTLEMINTGHAPLHILNVQQGQEVDVEVHPHKDEDYVQPKKKYVPFSGTGQRLGSPTPGATSSVAPPPAPSAAASTATTGSSAPPSVDIDSSAPTVTLQIRLGDGTRLTSRFNTTHTIGDVYSFVDRASPASGQRPYALMTTFPSKELNDKALILGDMAEFKRGGVVVQKWK